VARLLALQLLTVVAVTAVITGIYVLTGRGDNRAAVGSSSSNSPTASVAPTSPVTSPPPTTQPSAEPSASATTTSASPSTSSQPPVTTHRLKVDVLNQSGGKGAAAKFAARVRGLHWRVGRVDNFNGTVTRTTVYYPSGKSAAARELARRLPGNLRVLPRFSTLSGNRLTIIITG
jgi:hypothetical protein